MAKYIRKTSDIFISEELRKILLNFKDHSQIARVILARRVKRELLVEDHINYLSTSITDPNNMSYLNKLRMMKIKEDGVECLWESKKRYVGKPGGIVTKLFKEGTFSGPEIETFATLYKTFSIEKKLNWEIVKGSAIKDAYNWSNYASQYGSMGASCMKHDNCRGYLDIYEKNEDCVSLLILKNDGGKILGRTLLWVIGDKTFMDRIYTISDEEYSYHFKKWAIDNKIWYKQHQTWTNPIQFTNGKISNELRLSVKLKEGNFTYFPYMDTFKWLEKTNEGTYLLHNYQPDHFINTSDTSHKCLTCANGSHEYGDYMRFDDVRRIYSYRGDLVDIGGGILTSSGNCNYSTTHERYILCDEAIYSEELDDYIYRDGDRNDSILLQRRMDYIQERRNRNRNPTPFTFDSHLIYNQVVHHVMSELRTSTEAPQEQQSSQGEPTEERMDLSDVAQDMISQDLETLQEIGQERESINVTDLGESQGGVESNGEDLRESNSEEFVLPTNVQELENQIREQRISNRRSVAARWRDMMYYDYSPYLDRISREGTTETESGESTSTENDIEVTN
jgi:hypothetical protein